MYENRRIHYASLLTSLVGCSAFDLMDGLDPIRARGFQKNIFYDHEIKEP